MAHFAEINNSNVVIKVIVVGNDILTTDGPLGENDMHVDGETYCIKKYPHSSGIWKQTSYNNNFRKQYAGIGYIYDAEKNKFICPQPYSSWTLDANDNWQAPITYPTIVQLVGEEEIEHDIKWKESSQQWYMINEETEVVLIWNPETTSWS